MFFRRGHQDVHLRPTGSEDTFVVPAGVDIISVVATGAPGAVGLSGGSAGRGARVAGTDVATDFDAAQGDSRIGIPQEGPKY